MKNTRYNIVIRVTTIIENIVVVALACIGIYEYILPIQGILGSLANVAAAVVLGIYVYLSIHINIWVVDVQSPADAVRVMGQLMRLIHRKDR